LSFNAGASNCSGCFAGSNVHICSGFQLVFCRLLLLDCRDLH